MSLAPSSSSFPLLMVSLLLPEEDGETDETACRWRRREPTREVTSAAEEPRPVLWTSESVTTVCVKEGICAREDIRGSRPSSES